MKNLLLEDVKKIAVELGITLSYKNEEGKRKRYTKDELIAKIEEFENKESREVNAVNRKEIELNDYIIKDAQEVLKTKEMLNSEMIDKCNMYPNHNLIYGEISVNDSEFLMKDIVNNNPVITAKQFIKNNNIEELKELIDNLYQLSNDKNEKPIQRSKFSKSLNIIKALLSSRKVVF